MKGGFVWSVACLIAATVPAIAAAKCVDLPKAGDVRRLGWDRAGLTAARDAARAAHADAFMVITSGKVVLADGDVSKPLVIASMRKSVISALLGIAANEGKIALDAPVSRLGIDDPAGLTADEAKATVADLLHARSGVYIPASAETPARKEKRPARGSHLPGTHWYYNNWDFNVLGEIYQRTTGTPVVAAVWARLAKPLCMQDFDPYTGGQLLYDPTAPRFAAYHLLMSARDTARFGLLYLNGGRWNGQQIVPQRWVEETTRATSATGEKAGLFGGYGGLWWLTTEDPTLPPVLRGSYTASGYAGQQMTIIPSIDTIILTRARPRPVGTSTLGNFGRWQELVLKTLQARIVP